MEQNTWSFCFHIPLSVEKTRQQQHVFDIIHLFIQNVDSPTFLHSVDSASFFGRYCFGGSNAGMAIEKWQPVSFTFESDQFWGR